MKSIEMFHSNDIQPQAGSIDANIFPKLPLLMGKPSTAKIIRLIRTKINIHNMYYISFHFVEHAKQTA